VLAENFEMMEKLVGWYRSKSTDGLTSNVDGFGDWLQPHASNQRGDTSFDLLGTTFYAHGTQILADSARVLNRDEDAKRYAAEAAEAAEAKHAFCEQYIDANGKLQNAPETQMAHALAIAFDLIPADAKEKVGANLVHLLGEADVPYTPQARVSEPTNAG